MLTSKDIALMVDHSLLKPQLTTKQIIDGCSLAKAYNCISVCVRPDAVALAKKELTGTNVLVTSVVGFPHGDQLTKVKELEAKLAIEDGAIELDMVLNIG